MRYSLAENLSSIGFGGFRTRHDKKMHQQALEIALRSGVKVLDTSSHFQHGSSEKLIGETVEKLVKNKEIERASLTIMSKAGHIMNREYKSQSHSIDPKFLESEIHCSLGHLKTDYLDVFFLNSPEKLISIENKVNFYMAERFLLCCQLIFKFL